MNQLMSSVVPEEAVARRWLVVLASSGPLDADPGGATNVEKLVFTHH